MRGTAWPYSAAPIAIGQARKAAVATLIDGAGALLLEDWIRMDRLLPDPRTPVGYRRDGRTIFPILGAEPTDPSNQQIPAAPPVDSAMPPAARQPEVPGHNGLGAVGTDTQRTAT